MRSTALRRRLKKIVAHVFVGNVKAAAEAAGVTQPTLHRILAGKVKDPKLSTIERLADRFGVPLGWLTGETESLPVDESTGAKDIPPSWRLVSGFAQRRQRDDLRWLESVGPTNPEARRILKVYREAMRAQRAVFWASIRRRLGAPDYSSDQDLDAWRALNDIEITLVCHAAKALRRANEEG